ncbi:hypothetical protein EVAR_89902_1 [Eumeta japonica]|uniref:Uncharacterized protein n=1 Tax=Eumeta variegata TaxID=151549 RepID=A0A4C1YTB3_EUMVA|nr:hypothetical protein EVAR_89902_1 [Eumeta japonica]
MLSVYLYVCVAYEHTCVRVRVRVCACVCIGRDWHINNEARFFHRERMYHRRYLSARQLWRRSAGRSGESRGVKARQGDR